MRARPAAGAQGVRGVPEQAVRVLRSELHIDFAVDGGNRSCVDQKAAVAHIAETKKPFAVVDTNQANGACFHQEAARRKIVSGVSNDLFAEAELQALHPYMWQYSMAYEGLFSAIGEMICGRLHPGKAVYSSDATIKASERRFGVVLQVAERDGDISLRPLQREMAKCGATLDVQITQSFAVNSPEGSTEAQRAVIDLQDKKVTTVVCLCWINREQFMAAAATNQRYFPEWIMSSYGMNDTGWVQTYWTPEQRGAVMGVGSRAPSLTQRNDPTCYAATEGDPTTTCGADRGGGQAPRPPITRGRRASRTPGTSTGRSSSSRRPSRWRGRTSRPRRSPRACSRPRSRTPLTTRRMRARSGSSTATTA